MPVQNSGFITWVWCALADNIFFSNWGIDQFRKAQVSNARSLIGLRSYHGYWERFPFAGLQNFPKLFDLNFLYFQSIWGGGHLSMGKIIWQIDFGQLAGLSGLAKNIIRWTDKRAKRIRKIIPLGDSALELVYNTIEILYSVKYKA